MKYFLALTILLSMSFLAQAQDLDYPLAVEEEGLMKYMANLAWLNNPANDNFFQEEIIAKEQVKIAKRGWWKNIGITFNLNEANLKSKNKVGDNGVKQPGSDNVFFPKYNFGASFDLGSIFDTPNKKKMAERKVIMAESTTQQAKKDIRGKVIQMYQEYLTAIEILKLRYKSEGDMRANLILVKKLFSKGDKRVGLKDMNDASLALNNAQESRIKANKMMTIAKMKLEDFIGVKLEAVEAKFKK